MKKAAQNRSAFQRIAVFLMLFLFAASGVLRFAGETAAQSDSSIEREVFAQFDEWVAHYLSGNFAIEEESVRTGANLAEKRREAFKQLIRTNPQAALERAVRAETQKLLPDSVERFLEKSVAGRGDFNVLVIDYSDSAAEKFQIEREVVIGESRYKAFVYGRRAKMTTKLEIPLRGVVLDDLMAVDESAVRKIDRSDFAAYGVETPKIDNDGIVAEVGGELRYFADERKFEEFVRDTESWESKLSPKRDASLSPWTEGVKKLLFIRVDFPDREGVPVDRFGQVLTEPFAQELFDGPVNTFYFNNSYKKTSLRTTVTPVVRMPQPQSFYTRDNLYGLLVDARNAARAAGFETDIYELDMVAFSQSALLNFSGISPLANKGALINGNFTFKVVTHELGHAYGLLHANLWRTFDGTITGSGMNVEYGDDFDMMGRGATQATHFNANYKRSLDWLTEENIQTVTRPGVYRVYAHDTTAPQPVGIRALKIKKDAAKDYWVEFRQLMTNLPNLMDGALVRWDYPFDVTRQTQMLDMKPDTQTLDDSALTIGQTFNDDASGIKITVLGKGNTTPESLDIKVEFANFSAPFDFDGDGRTDIGVWRASSGSWWYLHSSDLSGHGHSFGLPDDIITPGDFTGDGKTDVAIWRPSTGEWFVRRSEDGSYFSYQFGLTGDIPAPADYDGDGITDTATFRPSTQTWYIFLSSSGTFGIVTFGLDGDRPVPADFDGDGKADIAVWRPSNGSWWIVRSSDLQQRGYGFGLGTDRPVPGDYTGDGKADIAVWRDATREWYFLRSEDGSYYSYPSGLPGDIPAPGDYDGDGKFDSAVFRPSTQTWYIDGSTAGSMIATFGLNGDRPVSNAFVP